MQNSIQNGQTMEYKPEEDIAGGDLVVLPAMVAVAITDIPAGATGALAAEGVFELPKDNTALAPGQAAYVKPDGVITASATDGQETGYLRAGVAWADAAGGGATVAVKINA